jgi:hypothetical protein
MDKYNTFRVYYYFIHTMKFSNKGRLFLTKINNAIHTNGTGHNIMGIFEVTN